MGNKVLKFNLHIILLAGILLINISCNKKQTSDVDVHQELEQVEQAGKLPTETNNEGKEVLEEEVAEKASNSTTENKEEEISKEKPEPTKTSGTTPPSKAYKLEVGKPFPAFELTDINGKVYSSEELKGKVKVFNFWFTSCKPCRDEIPELNLLVKQFAYRDDVVFIAPSFESKEKITTFTEEHPFQYNLIANVLKYNQSIGVRSYPVHLIIDKEEKVHTIVTQQYPTIKDIMANYIYNAIDGRSNDTKFEG